MPSVCVRPLVEQARNAADDVAELVVRQSPDEDAPVVVAIALGPLSQQRHEVARVPGDEDPSLLGSEGETSGSASAPRATSLARLSTS